MTHSLVIGHEGIKLVLTSKLPLCWLDFIILDGFILVSARVQSCLAVNSVKTAMTVTGIARYVRGWDSDMDVMGVANHFLIEFKVHSTGINTCLVL